jgi:NTP pyrophosphatase (non-canonical NTP hydrolase)
MNLATIEEQLRNWHGRKYGYGSDQDVAKTMRKLGEEFGEFIEAVINGEPGPIAEEAADVLFVMCHVVREYCGAGALNEAAVAKLGVIYERLQAEEELRPGKIAWVSAKDLPPLVRWQEGERFSVENVTIRSAVDPAVGGAELYTPCVPVSFIGAVGKVTFEQGTTE